MASPRRQTFNPNLDSGMSMSASPASSASVSRSQTSHTRLSTTADEMLRQSLSRSRGINSSPGSTTGPSVSRFKSSNVDTQKPAYDMLRQWKYATPAAMPPPYTPMDSATPSPMGFDERVDPEKLKLELQRDIDRASTARPARDTRGMFKTAASTDLLFMIDTTYSMDKYIEAVKQQVKSIIDDLGQAFLGEAQVRMAVVSYKDHNIQSHIGFLDFTTSVATVRSFIDGMETGSGEDVAEDVLGGINQAINASWTQQNRCIVHIGDAPPHGRNLHDLGGSYDDYRNPGSEPHGLTHEPLIKRLVQLRVNYAFLRIRAYTDRMALEFAKLYGPHNATLDKSNKYHGDVKDSIGTPRSSVVTGPQFQELPLGTDYSVIRKLVVRSVTTSFSRTAGRVTRTWNKPTKTDQSSPTTNQLAAICEDKDSPGHETYAALEKAPPQWDTAGWLDVSLDAKGFCPAAIVHNESTLTEMMAADENIKLSVIELELRYRSKPFAEGAMRLTSYARTMSSEDHFVVKALKKAQLGRVAVAEDMRIQALCKAFALEFNGLLDIEPPLDFVVSSCLEPRAHAAASGVSSGCLSLEPYIPGEYIKYNNNTSYVVDDSDLPDANFAQLAQAFSHFTFERSWGHLLVNDLQGVGHLLTDPTVQTSDPERFKLSDCNLNGESFKFFFATHKCNTYCEELGLQSNMEMFLPGNTFSFRERWPTMKPTVCCSNKLCRRILRLQSAFESQDYPKHHWCQSCWPQLAQSKASLICIELGSTHEFEVSRFYYESQGERVPKKCLEHRDKDTTASSTAFVGGSLFNMMKANQSVETINGKVW